MKRLKKYKNINLINKYIIKLSLICTIVILTHSTLHSKEPNKTPFKQGKMVVGAVGNLYFLPSYAIGLESFFSYLVLDNFSIGAGLGLNTDSNTFHFLMSLYGYNLFGTPKVTPTINAKVGIRLTHDRYKKRNLRVSLPHGGQVSE